MRRADPLRFAFDDEWDPWVRLEEFRRSGIKITTARKLAEQQRERHQARPDKRDPYWTPQGRLVHDWLQTLPDTGSALSTELYRAFIPWAGVDPMEFTQTRWGRLMAHWVPKRRTNRGYVYDGVSLP